MRQDSSTTYGIFHSCSASPLGTWAAIFWSAPILFDTVAVSLSLYKTWQLRHTAKRMIYNVLRFNIHGAFLLIFVIHVVNLVFSVTMRPGLEAINGPLAVAISSICTSSIVLEFAKMQAKARGYATTANVSMSLAELGSNDAAEPPRSTSLAAVQTSPPMEAKTYRRHFRSVLDNFIFRSAIPKPV